MLVPCHGGPIPARRTAYPPSPELEAEGGTYVLVDDGPTEQWWYEFVPAP